MNPAPTYISSDYDIYQCPISPSLFGTDNWGKVNVYQQVVSGITIGRGEIFEESSIYSAFTHVFRDGGKWQDTSWFKFNAKTIAKGKALWECKTESELLYRLDVQVAALYASMSRSGYLSQPEILQRVASGEPQLAIFSSSTYHSNISSKHEIKLGINETGDLLFLDGRHRLCIAKLLRLQNIPVRITFIHEDWLKRSRQSTGFTQASAVEAAITEALQLARLKGQKLNYITREEYTNRTRAIGAGHWKNADARWCYHEAAVECAKELQIDSADRILEMGTMGVSVAHGSHTIDYQEKWNVAGFRPTYNHDARVSPWPVGDRQYDLFIALRVFHHLMPVQRECFLEAKRIAKNIIIVCPETYDVSSLKDTSAGIPESEWVRWNLSTPPTRVVKLPDWIGKLYFWKESDLA